MMADYLFANNAFQASDMTRAQLGSKTRRAETEMNYSELHSMPRACAATLKKIRFCYDFQKWAGLNHSTRVVPATALWGRGQLGFAGNASSARTGMNRVGCPPNRSSGRHRQWPCRRIYRDDHVVSASKTVKNRSRSLYRYQNMNVD
jgi:hypothetical protein